ncbi:hypothetical protein RND81_10G170700 [Saponaria officinalis]|uniref:Uncharacterized protein n=1 Tax=Saponaria officinalis TaxID=3572 RepID=A0AAW1I5U2_SAPOF
MFTIMEQCSSFGWINYNEQEGLIGDMRQYILQSRMELEATIFGAQEEIMKKEEELLHMKDLLFLTIKERDEAHSRIHKLMLEKVFLQQKLQQNQLIIQQQQHHDEKPQHNQKSANKMTTKTLSSSSSESYDSSIISSSPCTANNNLILQPPPPKPLALPPQLVASHGPLPEKGKLLKAVMGAGPLLQTLLLAGPLPQWQHPPPQLESIEIPPLTIINPTTYSSPKKRGIDNLGCSIISSPKYLRVI